MHVGGFTLVAEDEECNITGFCKDSRDFDVHNIACHIAVVVECPISSVRCLMHTKIKKKKRGGVNSLLSYYRWCGCLLRLFASN